MNVSSSPNITFMLQYTEANSQYVDYNGGARDSVCMADTRYASKKSVKETTCGRKTHYNALQSCKGYNG